MKPQTAMRRALSDKAILGKILDGPTWSSWRILLTAAMGEPLKPDERATFTELTGRTTEPGQRVEELVAVVGRGHGDAGWRLQSTLCRHTYEGFVDAIGSMDEMLDRFYGCLASVGKLPRERMSRRVLLEYARHYGVPSPLIDFSRSPYVALWMAFNGVRRREKGMVSV
jgi:FRG domain